MEERIIELEKKLAFQEKAMDDHSEVLVAHQKKIAELESKLELLNDKIVDEGMVKERDEEEPPPHY